MDGEPTRADITAKVRQLLGQATLLRARGSRAEALKLAQEALTLDQAHADTHELIGDLLVDLNRGGEAVASFRRARELNPSRVTLEDKLARAALRRAAGLEAARNAEAVLSGTYKPAGPVHKPGYAALFSAFIPGLGQIYNEQLVKGLVVLVAYIILILLTSLGVRSSLAAGRWTSAYGPAPGMGSAFGGLNLVWMVLLAGLYIYAVADAAICAGKTMTSDRSGMV
jgi:TM2 domain-containing membrane protein YozV